MSYEYSMFFDEGLGSLLAVNGIGMAFSGLMNVALYVLTAWGLYTIAERRGIRKPWLACVPVVNVWILGSISDQYRYVVRGEIRSKRKALLGLSIVQTVAWVAVMVLSLVILGNVFFGVMNHASQHVLLGRILGPGIGLTVMLLVLGGVAIARTVISYMALYDVYTSCDPKNNVMYLVLSIVFSVTKPFFLFFNRHKDGGMPPRREALAYVPEESPVWNQPEEPEIWQQPETESE